jgi:hypothetical protein
MSTVHPITAGGDVRLVALDLYKDIHKGIRSELFTLTLDAGRTDATDRVGRRMLADHVAAVVDLLVSHAEHEDEAVQPSLETHLPDLAARVELDHLTLEARLDDLNGWAIEVIEAPAAAARERLHALYVELASFTGAYLAHQDVEERQIMPALMDAVGFDAVLAMHEAIVGSIPPEEMAASLAIMLPSMDVDDRAELLGGMRAGAPAEVFEGVWALAGSVLAPKDHQALAIRLDLS